MIRVMPVLLASLASAAELEMISGPGHAGALSWERLELVYQPEEAASSGRWHVGISGLATSATGALGSIHLHCRRGRLQPAATWCESGTIEWDQGPLLSMFEAGFTLLADERGVEVSLTGGQASGELRVSTANDRLAMALEFDDLPLLVFSDALLELLEIRDLAGSLSGNLHFAEGQFSGKLLFDDVGFDSLDGEMAGFGIEAETSFVVRPEATRTVFELGFAQSAGEMLFGQLYLPPPQEPLTLELSGHRRSDGNLVFEYLQLDDPGAILAQARLELGRTDEHWELLSAELGMLQMEFPLAWERWLDGPLAAVGLPGMETSGSLQASISLGQTGVVAEASLARFRFDDPQGRLGFDDLNAALVIADERHFLDAGWEAFSLFGLPFGRSELQLTGNEQRFELVDPVRMPLLDGAVVIDQLLWGGATADERGLRLDARIEPLSLTELTSLLGFPQFGGVLSGSFPGVRYADEVLSFTGGIDVRAFSGRIELSELAIERPFGTLQALTAEVAFDRLDLAEITRVFNFGHMEGQVSGWVRALRLLDWRPVAMDARLFTHEDAARRRISQRAVENLSNLGGAGGALISGTVLRVFDDFPYRRAGLACRLSNNICYIDGIAQHESGGFYIVQGRSLPRLDIIGHRRLVDWPQLMAQLAAMMEE